MRRYSSVSVSLSAVAISALVGGLFGPSLLATDDKIPEREKTFAAALSVGGFAIMFGAKFGMEQLLNRGAEYMTLPVLLAVVNELLGNPPIRQCTSYIVLSRQVPPRTEPLVRAAGAAAVRPARRRATPS